MYTHHNLSLSLSLTQILLTDYIFSFFNARPQSLALLLLLFLLSSALFLANFFVRMQFALFEGVLTVVWFACLLSYSVGRSPQSTPLPQDRSYFFWWFCRFAISQKERTMLTSLEASFQTHFATGMEFHKVIHTLFTLHWIWSNLYINGCVRLKKTTRCPRKYDTFKLIQNAGKSTTATAQTSQAPFHWIRCVDSLCALFLKDDDKIKAVHSMNIGV